MKLRKTRRKPITLSDVTIIDDSKLRQAIIAAALGNAVEWFDFGVYGYLVTALGSVFFPAVSHGVQLVATLATFSVPFLLRPIGGLFCGILGDKYGRKKVLAMTITLMTGSTFCIGLIPSYATIGMLAPILLLLCKMAQGFSVGGEYTGATIFVAEYSPDRKRGFMSSFLDFGSILGFVTGASIVELITALIGSQELIAWGWRLPFFLALPLGLIGIYLRHKMEETPTFQKQNEGSGQAGGEIQDPQDRPRVSFKEIFTKYWRSLLICIGLVIVCNATEYMLWTYLPSYLQDSLGYTPSRGLLIVIVVMIGMLFIQPFVGLLSDRIGRRPFILLGSLGLILLSIPAFHLIQNGSTLVIFLGLFILGATLNCFTGVTASILPALFPTQVRYSALASAFNVSVIIAGLTPTIVAWLVHITNNVMMPAYYVIGLGCIGIIAGICMKETANKPLRGATPAASDIHEAREILEEHHQTIEEKIGDLDAKIADLQQQRQRLIDQHPRIN